MAVLRVVGTDADHLLLLDADGGGHRVAIDDTLHEALKQASRVGTSRLTPREIQDRLRAGATVEQVADAAGVSVERIRRWEGPVLAERARALEAGQRARFSQPPDGHVSGPLVRLVTSRLDALGLVADWDAFRGADGDWVVVVRHERGEAQWQLRANGLAALDPHAESLGFREPPRAVDSVRDRVATPPAVGGDRPSGRGRATLPSWESILEQAPPPNAFPT